MPGTIAALSDYQYMTIEKRLVVHCLHGWYAVSAWLRLADIAGNVHVT